jgi:hypothetical protein
MRAAKFSSESQMETPTHHTSSTPQQRAHECLGYGVKKFTTVCTALLVLFTVLCATFFAVIAVLFATFLAVRTGPAWSVLAQTANARITENNTFMVLNIRSRQIMCAYVPDRFSSSERHPFL